MSSLFSYFVEDMFACGFHGTPVLKLFMDSLVETFNAFDYIRVVTLTFSFRICFLQTVKSETTEQRNLLAGERQRLTELRLQVKDVK